jgi:hypothetical protein
MWEDEPTVAQALRDSKVRFEAIHRYELDDDGHLSAIVSSQPMTDP